MISMRTDRHVVQYGQTTQRTIDRQTFAYSPFLINNRRYYWRGRQSSSSTDTSLFSITHISTSTLRTQYPTYNYWVEKADGTSTITCFDKLPLELLSPLLFTLSILSIVNLANEQELSHKDPPNERIRHAIFYREPRSFLRINKVDGRETSQAHLHIPLDAVQAIRS